MDWNTVSSLLWLLAWGALFFFMMSKGGCGMHGRGHHKDEEAAPGGDANHTAHRHNGC